MQKYNFHAKFFTNTISMAVNCDKLCKFKNVITKTILIISATTDYASRLSFSVQLIRFAGCHIIEGVKQLALLDRDFEAGKPRSEIHKLSELRRILLCFERGCTRAEWAEMNLRISFTPEPNAARDV